MRTHAVFCALIVSALVFCGGCSKPTHESVLKDGIAKMKELNTVLASITDESSASAAKPKLQAINADMKKIKEQNDKLPKMTADEEKALKAKYEKDIGSVTADLMSNAMRIGLNPTLAPILKDAMPSEPPVGMGAP
jgi:hypothetical protein